MELLVGRLEIHYLVANLIAIASCSVLNFVASDRLVFREAM
jgi:putative flippase GtrA